MAWRTNRLSIRSVSLLTNRLLLVGVAIEVALIALLSCTPGLQEVFHAGGLGPWNWLLLAAWPPLVLGAEELRTATARRRRSPRGSPGRGSP